ncbi:hypothetical protein QBC38DRAFT_426174 [Podospora fimiseda]|uniref:Trichothecene 3-O-acetyltransferase-like N-terminal domain-containing protein n=1 Tax=Podospora fimiseda TaxID=252190 RepID=A0AAN6YQE0_9PEZI|nr:hypothetical protein QBC38DRAFT_426174 [Podospora fimiseda]
MPQPEIITLRPTGWESDPEDECFQLSTLDYCVAQVFTNYALFFKLPPDADKNAIISILKRGLEITLSQCRQLCGILETLPSGQGLGFHKKRESTVEFHVQDLQDQGTLYPSLQDLASQNFVSQALGNLDTWCVAPMTYGEKPEAEPSTNPKASAFKASFIRGGLIFIMHHHHYANDVMGWAGELYQLAENCSAIFHNPTNPSLPPWDPSCLDLSRMTIPSPPESEMIEGPTSPLRHPGHKKSEWLLFHLPKSKAAALKALASPTDDNWISTYDAYTALIWRVLTKHRLTIYPHNLSDPLLFGEAVDMRRRMAVPPRMQSNVVAVALDSQLPDTPQLTVDQVAHSAPLSTLATHIRSLTNSITESTMTSTLQQISRVKDKTGLFLRIDSFPPLSTFVTDWRDTNPCEADFGFGKPVAMRFPFDTVTNGLTVVYPIRGDTGNEDEGNEFSVALEREIKEGLLRDEEWNEWFEFRGVDAEDWLR